MKKNKAYHIITIVITVLAVALDAFIIMHSCFDGDRSSQSSNSLVGVLVNVVNFFQHDLINDSNIDVFTLLVRKGIGHFGAFFVSGMLNTASIYLLMHKYKWYKHLWGILMTLGLGIFMAALTEIIQLFVPERSGQFSDVIIDLTGYILGAGLIVIVILLVLLQLGKLKEQKEDV